MEPFDFIGMNCIGNKKLLEEQRPRIGVFASQVQDQELELIREQWAIAKGRQHKCLVSTFHSKEEIEILYFNLKYGGYAIWFMGCALPKELPKFAQKYVKRGKLLIVSCFHREHHNIYTARYCCQLSSMVCGHLAFFGRKERGIHTPIYKKGKTQGKWIENF